MATPRLTGGLPTFSDIYLLNDQYATPELIRALHSAFDQLSAYLSLLQSSITYVGDAQDALLEQAAFAGGVRRGMLVYNAGGTWKPAVNSTDNTWAYAVAGNIESAKGSVQYAGRAQVAIAGTCNANDLLFLSESPGLATATRPTLTTVGLYQEIGMALSAPSNGLVEAALAFRIEPERVNV